ncbi:MAG TPA: protein kinase [Terriglobales bacterium]|nr:protein kinase [Terriglobales bacterium]
MIGETVSHYRILEKLGGGGMGVVYKAEDLKLGRFVALKFLPEHLSKHKLAIERFQREAKAASSLNHPHICTIYDVEEFEGRNFIAMEYLEGETLKRLIHDRGHALDTEHVTDYGYQMAEALEAAHSRAIVHRDIKPANIFVTDRGQIKLLDFGLAKLMLNPKDKAAQEDQTASAELTIGADQLTTTGVAMGTVAYMSPEQVRGDELDGRTDLFSLGMVLYEMATGKQAFSGSSSGVVIEAILNRAPTPPVRLNPSIPAQLEQIIGRALEKDKRLRYQTASDLRADLQRLKRDTDSSYTVSLTTSQAAKTVLKRYRPHFVWGGALAALLAVFGLNAGGLRNRVFGGGGSARIDSIAVLPFGNQSQDPKTEYLSDGITESLINSLSQLPNLTVTSRNTVFRYKGQSVDTQKVGHDLGVRAILTGRLIQDGDDLMISVDLEDVERNRQIWGEQYNRKLSNLPTVQEEIANDIFGRLRPKLDGEEKRNLAKRQTQNPEAYQLYLQGLFYWNKWTEGDFRRASDYFSQAVQKDPSYALSYAGLADTYSQLGDSGYLAPSEAWPKARSAAVQALEIDDSLAEAHTSLGLVKEHFEWDWPGAEKEFRRAMQLNPNLASAHLWYGEFLSNTGRLDEGLRETQRAKELDPLSLIINTNLGWQYYVNKDNQAAVDQLHRTLDLDPKFSLARRLLEQVYAQMGKQSEAVAEREKLLSLSGGAELATTIEEDFQKRGYMGVLQSWLDGLTEISKHSYVSPYSIAQAYARLGKKEAALTWLERAFAEHDSGMVSVAIDPIFSAMRNEARFKQLVKRMNLQG